MIDPITGLGLFKGIAETGKAIADIAKSVTDREMKQELNSVYDKLMELKQDVADLEDENRELKERSRFRSDEFEFRNPYYYEKRFPDRPLCPKCFVGSEKVAPMGNIWRDIRSAAYRTCLVCGRLEKA